MDMEGYKIDKEILKVGGITFQIAHKKSQKDRYLLKTASRQNSESNVETHFKCEFETAKKAGIGQGLLCPTAFIQDENSVGLVYTEAHFVPLSTILGKVENNVSFALKTGFALSQTLFNLHRTGYIHHEINPDNIWIDPKKDAVKLMGIGVSAKNTYFLNHGELRSKAYWMFKSPEQAGRVSSEIDERTDFYSLGALLYTIIAGRPPFDGEDFLELIHNHIAKNAPDLQQIIPETPRVLSEIVQKLMCKSADDRYHNAASIMVDMRRCIEALEIKKKIPLFRLDVLNDSNLFEYPNGIYGRDKELRHLSSSLDKVVEGINALTMVAGYSGVGKTSLIKAFEENIPRDRGYFAFGKYEPINSTIPYSGILKALEQIARFILIETDEKYRKIRTTLIESLGGNIGVITNLIPQFEPILGKAPFIADIKVIESRNRLHKCIQKIINVLCDQKMFLIIFLDDLQWVDQASLELIKSIIGSRGLFFIGAYRDNEVHSSHILKKELAQIEKNGIPIHTLPLHGLTRKNIETLFKDALRLKDIEIESLAKVTYQKTGGNPIVTKEFIKLLIKEKFIYLNNRMEWAWHLNDIKQIEINQDLDALALQKLNQLKKSVGQTISIAAVIGNSFHEKELAIYRNTSPEKLREHLQIACRKKILISLGKGQYQFEHDRLQENAYQIIPDDDKNQIHLCLGKSIAKDIDQDKNLIFKHITHLNFAHHLIKDKMEKIQLARLNLVAGKQAKEVAAFSESYRYFTTGIKVLGDHAWEHQYALTLELFYQASILAYLSGFLDDSEKLSQAIIQHGTTDTDKTLGYEARIECAIFLDTPNRAVQILLKALSRLGVALPQLSSRDEVIEETLKLKKIAHLLLEVPCSQVTLMTDSKFQTIMRLLAHGVKATGWHDFFCYWIFLEKMLKITQEHGFVEESAFGLVAAGGAFCHLLEDYRFGCRVAEYGLEYIEKNKCTKWKLDAQTYFHEETTCLQHPPDVTIKHLTAVYYQSIESGNIMTAIESAHAACLTGLFGNMNLPELKQLVVKFNEIISLSLPGIKSLQSNLKMINKIILGLSSPNEQRAIEDGICFEKSGTTRELPINFSLFLNTLFNRKEGAVKDAEELLSHGSNYIMIPTVFYSLLAILRKTEGDNRQRNIEKLYQQLKRRSKFSHGNFAHRLHLIQAEKFRLENKIDTALVHYEQAIFQAREKKFTMDEAIAWELTANFFNEIGAKRLSEAYMKEAFSAYAQWGGKAKLQQLCRSHVFLSNELPPNNGPVSTIPEISNTAYDQTSVMDMSSIDRAVVTLVSEMDGDTLLQRLMQILLQNSGAERGYLLSGKDGKILVECHASIEDNIAPLPPRSSIEKYELLSHSIVRYVCRTNKQVLSSNISEDDQFANTAYVKNINLKSVLSMPIAYQNKTVAIIYLENQQVKNAFSRERLHIIQLLSNQIAAAIERNRLNRELVQEIENRKSKEKELQVTVSRLNKLRNSLDEENQNLKEEIKNNHEFKDIIGNSPALERTLYLVKQVVSFDTTTLILGESGTGKELIARSIHEFSPRKDHPMVKVNCAALPAPLIESELFGYEKGAFTGAVKSQKGRFMMANGGTLFLDEIGDMPMEVQVKLLRVLQEGTFEPLGSDKTITVDVRVVAATNRDLEDLILKGGFREDLYYRLSIFPIKVPALRERKEDIPLLVSYFVDKKNQILKKSIKNIPANVMNTLTKYDWPGNIRELENTIERAVILSKGTTLTLDDSFKGMPAPLEALSTTDLNKIITAHIVHVLDICNWKVKGKGNAAEKLCLNPNTLRSKMRKLGIVRQ